MQIRQSFFTDVAADISNTARLSGTRNDTIEFITVGHLDAWRGFDLIIEAMAEAIKENTHLHLTIVGDGSDKKRLEELIKRFKLEKAVTLTGKVPMETYKTMMDRADVVINAALKEGAVTVSFDCMAMGKPLICLDTTGYTRYFTNEYAILIPRTGRKEVIQNIRDGILRLTDSREREMLGRKAQEASCKFSWENHGKEIRDAIVKTYISYSSK
ncbi:MAG: glycosyltransferase family 4 protein [Bacteroides cellulosilyticus]